MPTRPVARQLPYAVNGLDRGRGPVRVHPMITRLVSVLLARADSRSRTRGSSGTGRPAHSGQRSRPDISNLSTSSGCPTNKQRCLQAPSDALRPRCLGRAAARLEHGHAPDAEPRPQTMLLTSGSASSLMTPFHRHVVDHRVVPYQGERHHDCVPAGSVLAVHPWYNDDTYQHAQLVCRTRSTDAALLGQTVWVRCYGLGRDEQIVIVHVDQGSGPVEVARHHRTQPGSPAIIDDHFPPSWSGRWTAHRGPQRAGGGVPRLG